MRSTASDIVYFNGFADSTFLCSSGRPIKDIHKVGMTELVRLRHDSEDSRHPRMNLILTGMVSRSDKRVRAAVRH